MVRAAPHDVVGPRLVAVKLRHWPRRADVEALRVVAVVLVLVVHPAMVYPLLAGTLLLVPPVLYVRRTLEGRFDGSLIALYPHFIEGLYPQGNVSWGHLWFLAYLSVGACELAGRCQPSRLLLGIRAATPSPATR